MRLHDEIARRQFFYWYGYYQMLKRMSQPQPYLPHVRAATYYWNYEWNRPARYQNLLAIEDRNTYTGGRYETFAVTDSTQQSK